MRCPLLGNACFTPLSKPVSCENVSREPCPRLVIFWAAGILQPAGTCKMHPWQGPSTTATTSHAGSVKAAAGYSPGCLLVQEKDKPKISSSCWISKNCFCWRCLRARDVEEGRYLKQGGSSWVQNNTKVGCGSCHCLAGCQAVEPAEVVDRKGSTGVVLTVFKHRVNTGDKDWLWLQFSFIHYIALDPQREPRVSEKNEQWVCLVALDAELGSGSPARFIS